MSSFSRDLSDAGTMLQRVLKHVQRNFAVTILTTLSTPIIMLVLMYNLFGRGLEGSGDLGTSVTYINYLGPGLIVITAVYGVLSAAMRANTDMTQGIINRFRTMSIARISVLTGHVLGNVLITLATVSIIVVLVVLTGFRPVTSAGNIAAAIALMLLLITALSWLAVAIGVSSKSAEGVNGYLYILYTIPFLSSAFVPTTSMTPALSWFAENQPFSPVIDTMRSLLSGGDVGSRGLVAVAWCVALSLLGYFWARASYNRASAG